MLVDDSRNVVTLGEIPTKYCNYLKIDNNSEDSLFLTFYKIDFGRRKIKILDIQECCKFDLMNKLKEIFKEKFDGKSISVAKKSTNLTI